MFRFPVALLLCAMSAVAQSDPLSKALEFADLYNWADSEPYFEAAKASAGADTRKALYAEFGLVRATMERRVLPQTSEWLANQLRHNPLLQAEDDLRLFTLTVKADIDFEIDALPAKDDWQQVLALAERTNNQKWIRRAKAELGFVSFVEGDVSRALQAILAAMAGSKQSNDVGALIRYYGAFGTGLSMTKNHQPGLDRINDALAVEAQNQPQAGYNFPAREGKVMALLGLNRKEEAYTLAAELLTQARARHKKVKECQLLLLLGKQFRADGNNEQAKAVFNQARELAEAGGFKRFLADAYNLLALAAIKDGDKQTAVAFALKAAENTRESGDVYLLPDRLLTLARLQTGLGNREEARLAFERAEEVGSLVLGWATLIQTRSSLVDTLTDLYKEHFLFYAKTGDVAGSFRVLENNRAKTTRDMIAANEPVTGEVAMGLRARLAGTVSLAEMSAVRGALVTDSEKQWTEYQRKTVKPSDLKEIQAALGSNQVILEYALTDPTSYCIVVTKQTARIVPLSKGEKELETLLKRYSDTLKHKGEDEAVAEQLYTALLGPIAELSNHTEVLISRDGALHLIPFEALVGPRKQYVVMTHEVSYIPSASTFRLLHQQPRKATQLATTFLGVGGLPYDASVRPKIATTRGYAEQLGNLPGSADEIRNASIIAPGRSKLLLGGEATETAFKKSAADYRIIHLAVHGRSNSVYPEQAALMLMPDASAKEDGLLSGYEIVALRISADLVVLSACETSVGKLVGQDGVANLSRAFITGGTRTVVSTLWAADDTSATSLLKRFYAQLQGKADVAHALTAAKRDLIKTFHATPYLWAPYIVDGIGTFRVQ